MVLRCLHIELNVYWIYIALYVAKYYIVDIISHIKRNCNTTDRSHGGEPAGEPDKSDSARTFFVVGQSKRQIGSRRRLDRRSDAAARQKSGAVLEATGFIYIFSFGGRRLIRSRRMVVRIRAEAYKREGAKQRRGRG